MSLQLEFLGVGSAGSALGCASAVLMHQPQHNCNHLLIDCGFGTIEKFIKRFNKLPQALYITHLHSDHIGDLETLFFKHYFAERQLPPIQLFIAAKLIPWLCQRVANYPGQIAEGGANFWDSFQLIPALESFWWQDLQFHIYPTRHHQPQTAFALHLPGQFFYSGDTRPIPEILHHYCNQEEIIFHDCGLNGNPSHSGVAELNHEYRESMLNRLVVYHYHSKADGVAIHQQGLQIAKAGISYDLAAAKQPAARLSITRRA